MTAVHRRVPRRLYRRHLTCQDCGQGPATIVTFWLNGLRYRVCSTCIRPYRGSILKPCACER